MALTMLYKQLQTLFPTAFWQGDPTRREIALTFDDGPDAASTPALLEVLAAYQMKATFFHIGQRAQRAPDLVAQVAAAGHQIGIHGYEHQSFLIKDRKTLLDELTKTQQILAEASGQAAHTFNAVRPPFGQFSPLTLETLNAAGFLPTMWSVVPFHWLQSAEMTRRQILSELQNGTIWVMHEALPGPSVVELTITVLPALLDQGFRFVTVRELWANFQQKATPTHPELMSNTSL